MNEHSSGYFREWKIEDPKANVLLVHGLGEHSGRYQHVGEYFAEAGYNVYSGDLTGHGQSEGERGHVLSVDEYIQDIQGILYRIDNDKPIFLLGHDLGGLLVLYYGVFVENDNVQGIIALSPYIREKKPISSMKQAFVGVVNKLSPDSQLTNGIDPVDLSHDEKVVEAFINDELNHSNITVGWYSAMKKAIRSLMENAHDFKYPCLIIQAEDDLIVDPYGASDVFSKIGFEDKDFEMLSDMYHEVLNEPDHDVVLEKIENWIEGRMYEEV